MTISNREQQVLLKTDLPGIPLFRAGKVRDVYDLGEHFLVVTTDRVSAFDVVLPNGIPDKGKVLTRLSEFWFNLLEIPNHLVTTDVAAMPESVQPFRDQLAGRTMLVDRLEMFPVECVARGYLAGSGWVGYQRDRSVCGISLPEGLQESSQLPAPIFTPATKAEEGHDENISIEAVAKIIGAERSGELRDQTLGLYQKAAEYARERGIIIADTKFEFGTRGAGRSPAESPAESPAVLGDEVLTPDSSRFWDAEKYVPGKSQPSLDKQYVRDYLLGLDWDRTAPGPELPAAVVEETARRYRDIYERLTGKSWA